MEKNPFEAVIEQLASRTEAQVKRNPEDYEMDGLLYCGRCKSPKQVRFEAFGRMWEPFCICKCESQTLEDEAIQERIRARMATAEKRRKQAFGDSKYFFATFDKGTGFDERPLTVCIKYVDNFSELAAGGRGLILFGGVGTGKTYLAACVANALIDAGKKVLFTSLGRIVRDKYDVDDLLEYDLIVLDDFAAERDTEYMNEQVLTVLDELIKANKPMILTTNLTSEELKTPPDVVRNRMYSRIYEACFPVEVKGADRRRTQLGDDYRKYKDLLGL